MTTSSTADRDLRIRAVAALRQIEAQAQRLVNDIELRDIGKMEIADHLSAIRLIAIRAIEECKP